MDQHPPVAGEEMPGCPAEKARQAVLPEYGVVVVVGREGGGPLE